MLTLRRLTKDDEQAFNIALKEWETPELAKRWLSCGQEGSFRELLLTFDRWYSGIDMPHDCVPCNAMFAFIDDKIVGRLTIRHKLTDALQIYAGHIGYSVIAQYRRKGYATSMLKQALPMCAELGIKEALLTIDKLNYASIMVVKKCGGILVDELLGCRSSSNNAKMDHKDMSDKFCVQSDWL